MVMEVAGKAIASGPDEIIAAWLMLPDVIFRIEHLLCQADRNFKSDPIFGWGSNEFVFHDTEAGNPLVYQVQALVMGCDKPFDLFLGKVLAIALMVRIADFVEVLFQNMEVRLWESNTKHDFVVGGRLAVLDPSSRRGDRLFDVISTIFGRNSSRQGMS
jgi:hypothetical protein